MSNLIRFTSIDDSKRRKIIIAGAWILASCILMMSMCVSLAAQQPAAQAEEVQTMKFADAYDMTKPELQEKASETKEESRARRAKLKEVRDRIRAAEKQIKFALEGSGDISSVSNTFNAFMPGYVFARMTQTDKETLATLGEIREEFIDDYLSEKVRGGARQRVIQTTVPVLQTIVNGDKFDRAVRLNAVLTLGMIDSTPASRRTDTLPQPSADALRVLTQVFTSDVPVVLKIGALSGIQRHAEIDHLRTQSQMAGVNTIVNEALSIVQGRGTGSDNWPPEGKYWLKRRCIQVLGFLGQSEAVVDELVKIAADKDESKWSRFDAIAALGKMKLTGVDAQKVANVPKIVGEFVADSLEFESVDLKEKLDNLIATNILYDDVDLVKEGNADSGNRRPKRNIGLGMPTGGEDAGSSEDEKDEIDLGPRVEIPTYHLNNARRKVKIIAYTAKRTLESDSLKPLVDAVLVAKLTTELGDFINSSDVGIIDLDEEPFSLDEDDPRYEEKLKEAQKPNTLKMAEFYGASAKDIRRLFASANQNAVPGKPAGKAGAERPF